MPSKIETDEKLASNIIPRVQQRLDTLVIRIRGVDEEAANFGPLLFLKHEFDKGSLRGLVVLRDKNARQDMQYRLDQAQRQLILSDRLLSTISILSKERKLNPRRIDWLIDNFLIHEFLHMAQGMSGNRHSDLRIQSPKVLLAIDYQADAAAIVISMILGRFEPEAFGFRRDEIKGNPLILGQEGVQAVLHQIELFRTHHLVAQGRVWSGDKDHVSLR